MTDHEGDRLYFLSQGILESVANWSDAQGEAVGDRSLFPDPHPESPIVSLSPKCVVFICILYHHIGNTKMGNRNQTMQMSFLN